MSGYPALGIDIGGTKLAAGVVNSDGQILSYIRQPTPTELDAEVVFAAIVALAKRACQESGATPDRIGIGCGGPMVFPEGIVSPLHMPMWRAFPLRERVQAALGLPAIVDNDAKALALGEAYFGAGRGARCLLGMTVSTGVGGGIVVDGKLFHGATGNAGHIGHVIVSPRGPRCECGAIGCVTAYAAGTGIAARARHALKRGTPSSLAGLPIEQVTGRAVAEAAASGDLLGDRLMRDAALALGRGIASAANILDLDRVVIGGGVAQSGELLFAPLRQELKRRARLAFSKNLEVLPAQLGTEAGVIGASALAFQDLERIR